ncbi:MAG TPA: sulfotransferase, partial [Steroidobacteraceae bacterium]
MWPKLSKSRKVSEVGTSLADTLMAAAVTGNARSSGTRQFKSPRPQLQAFLTQVDRNVVPMQLGVFRRAKLANFFKWRLLEGGLEQAVADELTQLLLVRLATKPATMPAPDERSVDMLSPRQSHRGIETLLSQAEACAARNAHDEAVGHYLQLLEVKPRHLLARNNLGTSLCRLGRYREAEEEFHEATVIQPKYGEAQFNLGTLLRDTGRLVESEMPLRRAVKFNPTHPESHASLGATLMALGRPAEARQCFERALKIAPRHAGALCGLGHVAMIEGRFDEATANFKRALVFDKQQTGAWAGLVRVRKMTSADGDWLRNAETVASSGLPPLQEADLRFAIGKYYDDVGNFERAFRSYERANRLQKAAAQDYDRDRWSRYVDDMIQAYPHGSLSSTKASANDSALPVFVTGMMRSGTSLVEQIIASHPLARGAGELSFWTDAMRKHYDAIRGRGLDQPLRNKLAEGYLRVLRSRFPDAGRIVDKATFNSDYLGPIHSVFPNARIIYVQRDPIDTCLSCYFQQFSAAHSFALDLADLTHYYREHRRLVDHWRAVLPPGALLQVHYADLVKDKENWSRKILDFVGLKWDERCLEFHATERPVLTSSYWQVRQKMYSSSVGRWR